MKNIKSIINSHNKKILNQDQETKNMCNCIIKNQCPFQNACLSTNIVYEAQIASTSNVNIKKTYLGITEGTFKKRYANHKKSFNHPKYRNETELSKDFWRIKEKNEVPTITWKTRKKCHQSSTPPTCNLCLNEKLEIITSKDDSLLNSRDELVSKCRHFNKFKLINSKKPSGIK